MCILGESLTDLDLRETVPASGLAASGMGGMVGGARDNARRGTGAAGSVVVLAESDEGARKTLLRGDV